jgi:hypothetical protein
MAATKTVEKNHEVSRTVYINKAPVKIDFAYDLCADDEKARKNKEAAFDAAIAKLYPQATRTRAGKFHYTLG